LDSNDDNVRIHDDIISDGRPFYVLATAMGHARSPMVHSQIVGTASDEADDELRCRRPGWSVTGCN